MAVTTRWDRVAFFLGATGLGLTLAMATAPVPEGTASAEEEPQKCPPHSWTSTAIDGTCTCSCGCPGKQSCTGQRCDFCGSIGGGTCNPCVCTHNHGKR